MAEPITTTSATGVVTVGIWALLTGWLGNIGADIMMVVLSAIAGCSIALTGKVKTFWASTFFISKGILLALVLAWTIASGLGSYMPSLNTPYLPSMIAFFLGFTVDKASLIIDSILNRFLSYDKSQENKEK